MSSSFALAASSIRPFLARSKNWFPRGSNCFKGKCNFPLFHIHILIYALTDLKNTMKDPRERKSCQLWPFCFLCWLEGNLPAALFRPGAERWQHFGCLTLIARTLRDELLDNAEICSLPFCDGARRGQIFSLYEISTINRSAAFVLTIGAAPFPPRRRAKMEI